MLTTPPCGFHGTSRYNILFQIAPNDRDDDDNENEGENDYDDCGDGNVIFAKGIPRMIIGFTLIHEKPKMVTMTLVMFSLATIKPRLIFAMLIPHFHHNFLCS